MRTAVLALLAGLACACSPSSPARTPSDDELLVSRLLALENPAFEREGEYDAFAEYQAWEALYVRSFERARDPKGADEAAVKRFLLVGAIARDRLDAGTTEAFTPDLMQVYETRPDAVLEALRDVPFLVSPTCHSLGAFFGFEDRHVGGKPAFLEAERERIRSGLPADLAEECLEAIEEAE